MATNTTSDERIGDYKYIRTIYPGSTSMVLEVLHEASNKRFAVKQLLASRSGDASERRAFEFEAKLGREFHHPNLIKVHHYVKDAEQPYFVMDYFPGFQLRLALHRPKDFPVLQDQPAQDHHAGGVRAGLHARQGLDPPRREAREHHVQQDRRGPGDRLHADPAAGLGPGQAVRDEGPSPGDQELHVARADPLRVARPDGRYLQLRDHLL